MIERFKVEPIGKYISVQGGFAYKSIDFVSFGLPVLKIKNIKAREVDTSEVVYVSDEIAQKTSSYFVHPQDILISMTGSGIQAPVWWSQKSGQFLVENKTKHNHSRKLVLSARIDLRWCLIVQRLMKPLLIVKREVRSQVADRVCHALVIFDVHLLIFDTAP
jgi:hypothetical protein